MIAVASFDDILPHVVILGKGKAAASALKAVLDKVPNGQTNIAKTNGLSPQFCDGNITMKSVRSIPLFSETSG